MSSYATENSSAERLAIALGWFSIGLGLSELIAPHGLARLIGVRRGPRTATTIRTMGAREVGNGLAILARPDQPATVWGRVAGDALDLSLLGTAMRSEQNDRGRAIAATAAVVGVTIADVVCALQLKREADQGIARTQHVRVDTVLTIRRSLNEVYQFWRRFENFPQFMQHLESVNKIGDRELRWSAKSPAGTTLEWDAEIVAEREGEFIGWHTLPGSDIEHGGSVRFSHAPGGRGTEIHVELEYAPPAGQVGRVIAKMLGEEPEQQIRDDLRRFKQLMEAGEIAYSDGPGLWRPARPAGIETASSIGAAR